MALGVEEVAPVMKELGKNISGWHFMNCLPELPITLISMIDGVLARLK
jgi:hypothetical protein